MTHKPQPEQFVSILAFVNVISKEFRTDYHMVAQCASLPVEFCITRWRVRAV